VTWEELTAVSTLLLAVVTWRLARSTRILAGEANAETRANWRPVIIPDLGVDGDENGLTLEGKILSMRVRNIGRGPALTIRAALHEEGNVSRRVFRARARSDVLAPGERMTFEWREFDPPKPSAEEGIHVWSQLDGMITYGDVGYVRYETEIKVGFRVDGAVSLIDHHFLGAARDRLRRSDRVRYRAVLGAIAIEERIPRRFPLGRRLGRAVIKRLG
jgi:hypothetical protein